MKQSKTLRRWELALLLGVACAALLGVWLDGAQAALSDQVVRLHVLANSDSEADQALKLRVRDRILAEAGDLFAQGLIRLRVGIGDDVQAYDLVRQGGLLAAEPHAQEGCKGHAQEECQLPALQLVLRTVPVGMRHKIHLQLCSGYIVDRPAGKYTQK